MGRLVILFGVAAAGGVFSAFGQPWSIEHTGGENATAPTSSLARCVEGIPVPPFGASLELSGKHGFVPNEGFAFDHLAAWPGPSPTPEAELPLAQNRWSGPYKNTAGQRWVEQINAWYRDGQAAGLTQDTFRSFDNGHSGLPLGSYPQMHSESPVAAFGSAWENIFRPRVTMGVQSYGSEGSSVIEAESRRLLRAFYETKPDKPGFQRFFRTFYENNFLFAAPAVGSYSLDNDVFAFLSPFYLHSIGASGTDARLLKPLVLASAALPPGIKTRMLRNGLFVPTLMYLFKSHIAGGIKSPEAHVPAYTLPPEATDDFEGPSPFLDGLLNAAHGLAHIPPVCRLKIVNFDLEAEEGHDYGGRAYHEDNTYAFTGALRQGQTFALKVDLRYSWTDEDRPIKAYYAKVLRGAGTIEPVNAEQSVLKITVPWSPTDNRRNFRTDILLLVHDGSYYSAPAYISVRHIHRLDPVTRGIRAR